MALRGAAAFLLLLALVANAEDCSLPSCLLVDGHAVRCQEPSLYEYLPHPTDCHQFIRCTGGGPLPLSCSPGTAWDQDLHTCAHEATVASCNKAPEICDCDCCFRADPDEVAGFIYCQTSVGDDKATPYKLHCPEGRNWDDSAKLCA
ncbi:peritrophin-1-like [Penaeus japonicus]|uniref:peritrophin-1-like n=1 Tax=Penaeus japonicus TaxID=27405 RepID=UPI001C70B5FD|nr:peritrophin-1-like [Penaeus japonicus]